MIAAAPHRPFVALTRTSWLVPAVGVSVTAIGLGKLAVDPATLRLALAAAAAVLVIGVGLRAPRVLLILLIAWFAALGLVRRLASGWADFGVVDPLLILGPLALAVLAVSAIASGALSRLSKLANGVLVFSGLLVVGALNPLQGSVLTGLAGLLFALVPLSAFWIGRGLREDRLFERSLKAIALLGVAAALYGLGQTLIRFPSWDAAWIEERGYGALNVGGVIRPFSTFSSAAEYGFFLSIAILVWVVLAVKGRRLLLALATVPLLAIALLYESSRSIVVLLLLALVAIFCAWRRIRPLAALAIAGCCLISVPLVATLLVPPAQTSRSASPLLAHQAEGLANPLDPEASTLLIHIDLVQKGLASALEHPVGVGIGPVTIAAEKFGGETRSTEADPSNVATALGFPGLAVYLFIVVVGISRAYDLARRRRDVLSLVALGLLVATLSQWLNGGQYAVAFLPWLVLGWLDQASTEPTTAAPLPTEANT